MTAFLTRPFRLQTVRELAFLLLGGLTAIVGFTVQVAGLAAGPLAGRGTSADMANRPKRNWIQEERRRTLGDWVAFCPSCGHVARYFEEHEAERPAVCPQCATTLVARCPACDARLPSAFGIECEECGEALRPNELFGGAIRRPGR